MEKTDVVGGVDEVGPGAEGETVSTYAGPQENDPLGGWLGWET